MVVVEEIKMRELFEALCRAKNVDYMLRKGTKTVYYIWCNEGIYSYFKQFNCLATLGEAD